MVTQLSSASVPMDDPVISVVHPVYQPRRLISKSQRLQTSVVFRVQRCHALPETASKRQMSQPCRLIWACSQSHCTVQYDARAKQREGQSQLNHGLLTKERCRDVGSARGCHETADKHGDSFELDINRATFHCIPGFCTARSAPGHVRHSPTNCDPRYAGDHGKAVLDAANGASRLSRGVDSCG
ncbi:hypothetical protein N657DRAFT_377780 [Parathielavia appendiculata]|uniref:Uncharacterized protein n=1 Tax=Parathielavia appendiculata TaxID=2587402 RepID=A0AAN6U0H2_9PEZI|nr:hypothetical protein N657DRAFT_377780 [Parathielavia appendiculata]